MHTMLSPPRENCPGCFLPHGERKRRRACQLHAVSMRCVCECQCNKDRDAGRLKIRVPGWMPCSRCWREDALPSLPESGSHGNMPCMDVFRELTRHSKFPPRQCIPCPGVDLPSHLSVSMLLHWHAPGGSWGNVSPLPPLPLPIESLPQSMGGEERGGNAPPAPASLISKPHTLPVSCLGRRRDGMNMERKGRKLFKGTTAYIW